VPDTFGWIDTLGVDPTFQHRGIGRALFNSLIEIFKNTGRQGTLETEGREVEGVNVVYTLTSWSDWDLLRFYHAMGFKKGEMLNLQLTIR
jgi:ribosomal protein S18 acetylase RimI-like enzyme